ncbi:MAG: FecR domain-containing protein [Elusimicrobia bacterium]|nr:FecR domain-containing protein [Elusimicrobiota bacterium]
MFSFPCSAEESETTIVSVNGTVEFLSGRQEQWTPAEAGTLLEPGDSVRTGKNSSAEIMTAEENVLDLSENSVFSVPKEEAHSSFFLRAGTVLARIKSFLKGEKRFRIRTPTAVAAVRGTQFGITASEEETSAGVFDEGVLEVESLDSQGNPLGEKVTLNPGEETTAKLGLPPIRPRPLLLLAKHREKMRSLRGRLRFLQKQRRMLLQKKRHHLKRRIQEKKQRRF